MKTLRGHLALVAAALLIGVLAVGCGTAETEVVATSVNPSSPDARLKPHQRAQSESFDAGRSRIAHMFVDFARGETDGLPVDTPVALYLGNAYERTIPDGQYHQRSQWRLCDEYRQHGCPSALEVLAGSPGHVAIADSVASACLASLAEPPSDTGGPYQVVLSPPEPRTCADDYAVQLWINDMGQITAVNLLLGNGS